MPHPATFLLPLCLLLSWPARAAEPLKLISDENAPFASTDPVSKAVTGITFEMVSEASRRAGIPYTIELYPWARAIWRGQNETDTCVYPVARLAQRESQFQWVGPLSKNTWVLYARSDFRGAIGTLEDARKYKIGGLLQDGPSVFLASHGVDVELLGTNELNFNKLLAGRIDLWATGYFRGKLVAKGSAETIKPVFVIHEVDHYLACHLKVPQRRIRALNQAVASMWQDGWMKRVNDKYERWSAD